MGIFFGRATALLTPQPPIFGQGSLKGRKNWLALADLTACETVAVYNALNLSGRGIAYSAVRRSFLFCGALTLWPLGFFGGNPYSIGRVLRRFGIKTKRLRFDEAAKSTCIMSFFNPRSLSLHTVFVRQTGSGPIAYNLYGSDKAPRRFDPETERTSFIAAWEA